MKMQKIRCLQFEALSFELWSSLCTRRCRQDCTKHRGGKHQLDCEQLQIITAQSLCIRITRIDNIWLKLSHSIQDFSASSTNLRVIFLNVLNENDNDIFRFTLYELPYKDSYQRFLRPSEQLKSLKREDTQKRGGAAHTKARMPGVEKSAILPDPVVPSQWQEVTLHVLTNF